MAEGLDRDRLLAWCRGIDAGPFSSISAGERITFRNLEGLTLCAAAAALTSRVRVLVNVAVAPWHPPAMLAKQVATIDVIADGRCELAVGVGGRTEDYEALGSPFGHRHQRLDDSVAEIRRLWAQEPATDGQPVGPTPVLPGGPPIFASAMGPMAMARAAHWAQGVSGFSLLGDPADAAASRAQAIEAWERCGRRERPRIISGAFVTLGPDAEATLKSFAYDYLAVFGDEGARVLAGMLTLHSEERLLEVLDGMRGAGCDEFILVPGDSDPDCLARLTDVVGRWNR
jgi:alkanesulfonate monooxygenase SsuD/methylene tetrahydromethanopterin reductase-like flavin-dependent oxidoreductase (luciferase family)